MCVRSNTDGSDFTGVSQCRVRAGLLSGTVHFDVMVFVLAHH